MTTTASGEQVKDTKTTNAAKRKLKTWRATLFGLLGASNIAAGTPVPDFPTDLSAANGCSPGPLPELMRTFTSSDDANRISVKPGTPGEPVRDACRHAVSEEWTGKTVLPDDAAALSAAATSALDGA
jgi:hypothetical protein